MLIPPKKIFTFPSFLVQKNTSTVANSTSNINKQSVATNSTQSSKGTSTKGTSKKSNKIIICNIAMLIYDINLTDFD